ncbi:unnamed protein product [Ixodes pacificus]
MCPINRQACLRFLCSRSFQDRSCTELRICQEPTLRHNRGIKTIMTRCRKADWDSQVLFIRNKILHGGQELLLNQKFSRLCDKTLKLTILECCQPKWQLEETI